MADEVASGKTGGARLAEAVTGPYGVLAVVAGAIETPLGIWLNHAQNPGEREFAGSLMTLILVIVVSAVVWIASNRKMAQAMPEAVKAANVLDSNPVSRSEVEAIPRARADEDDRADSDQNEIVAAPDGAYIIARPGKGWSIRKATIGGVLKEKLGVKDYPQPSDDFSGSVLVLEFGGSVNYEPRPGKTRCNGRIYPLLLSEKMRRNLQITTLSHWQPPFYLKNSLYDNVINVVSKNVSMQLVSIAAVALGKLPRSNKDMFIVDEIQRLENVCLDERDVRFFTISIRFTAVRGDLVDYVFVASNFWEGDVKDDEANRFDGDITEIFSTFRPTAPADLTSEERTKSAAADESYADNFASINEFMFDRFLHVAHLRLREIDHTTPDGFALAVRCLEPFRAMAKSLPSREAAFEPVWAAIEQVKHGDGSSLRQLLDANRNQIDDAASEGELSLKLEKASVAKPFN